MIFYLLFIIILILIGKHIYEIHNFNYEANIEQLQSANKEEIFEKYKERKPLLIHNLGTKNDKIRELTIQKLISENPGYIINDKQKNISLSVFDDPKVNQMNIYKNSKLCKDLNLENDMNDIYKPFESKIHCNKKYYLSLLKGSNAISLTQNKHNLLLIHQIQGVSKLYLFNPKHKQDIILKDNNEIKKWGQKINLVSGLVLYIPIEWYYFFETDEDSIIGEIESDNYFTVLYNNLR